MKVYSTTDLIYMLFIEASPKVDKCFSLVGEIEKTLGKEYDTLGCPQGDIEFNLGSLLLLPQGPGFKISEGGSSPHFSWISCTLTIEIRRHNPVKLQFQHDCLFCTPDKGNLGSYDLLKFDDNLHLDDDEHYKKAIMLVQSRLAEIQIQLASECRR